MEAIAKNIWDLLIKAIKNPYGVAAIMGNLKAESSLNPLCMTGKKASEWPFHEEYVMAINSGAYDKYSFGHDGIAFGLVQWLYYSRKESLYDFAKGKDIGSYRTQIEFMLDELPKYKLAWSSVINAIDIDTPCIQVMERYEKPGSVTEAAKQKRIGYGREYYNAFTGKKEDPEIKKGSLMTMMDRVNVRCGNGIEYGRIGQIEKSGTILECVAKAKANDWYAVVVPSRTKQVGWISGRYVKGCD